MEEKTNSNDLDLILNQEQLKIDALAAKLDTITHMRQQAIWELQKKINLKYQQCQPFLKLVNSDDLVVDYVYNSQKFKLHLNFSRFTIQKEVICPVCNKFPMALVYENLQVIRYKCNCHYILEISPENFNNIYNKPGRLCDIPVSNDEFVHILNFLDNEIVKLYPRFLRNYSKELLDRKAKIEAELKLYEGK